MQAIFKAASALALILFPVASKELPTFQFFIWNVGQGSAATVVSETECWHFDMGGEKLPSTSLQKYCGNKLNRLFLSHYDSDHVNQAPSLPRNFCRMNDPLSKSSFWKSKLKSMSPLCAENFQSQNQVRISGIEIFRIYRSSILPKNSNDSSEVFWIPTFSILISGDSPAKLEKIWSAKITDRVRILILGHHGSRTSNSKELMLRSRPIIAIASARKAKYGHPHAEVLDRLQANHIPLLSTEQWGNLHFILNMNWHQ